MKLARLIPVVALALPFLAGPFAANAQAPDPTLSYFVPQTGMQGAGATENASPAPDPPVDDPSTVPVTSAGSVSAGGTNFASRLFRGCPNNDGGASFPNNARIKIVVIDDTSSHLPMAGIPASDICIVFRGGTPGQGYTTGVGAADSIIAGGTYNPGCPTFPAGAYTPDPGGFCLQADGQTDASGTTYITLIGGAYLNGVAQRDPNRKWGHYDSDLPVYVKGVRVFGIWNSSYAPTVTPNTFPFPSYDLRIKSLDWAGGLTTALNQGEMVNTLDFNGVANGINVNNLISYWKDFDFSGAVKSADLNIVSVHLNHNCSNPNNP